MKRKVIAVTGGVGSGKSAVCACLAQKGFDVVDCDQISRDVADLSETVEEVRQLLGNDVICDGKLDRRAVRNRVFAGKQLLEKYNGIFFEKIRKELTRRVERSSGTVFVEIPLFNAFPFRWDGVWNVVAERQDRVLRVVLRDNVEESNVELIMSRQVDVDDASYTIYNNGSMFQLRLAVDVALTVNKLQS